MKAMRLYSSSSGPAGTAALAMEEIAAPTPGAGQVRIRVRACGVCHTDLHIVEGDIHPPRLPLTPGHQAVGVIDALGAGVEGSLSLGQRAGVPWLHAACSACDYCRSGRENLCPQARFTGFDVDGGYAQWMLAQAEYALPLPEEISDEQAAPLLCAGIIGYRSLRLAEAQQGQRLGLVGFGGSAHLAIQVARHWGCEVYVMTRSKAHQEHARELGAAWAGEASAGLPELLDCAVIFAPAGELVPLTLEKLRPGGVLAINAIHMSPIPEMPYRLIYGERTVRSVANATRQDGIEFLALAAKINIHSTVTLYPLEEANRALLDLKASRINGQAVLAMQHGII
ncbi:MAG: zinc-dependent alcohol dehydrogenase family protein [Chloroflexi bacterium]|nr:zinc-dependent alcohol dehydrogenase family protein [Chloroflexota bacterium]